MKRLKVVSLLIFVVALFISGVSINTDDVKAGNLVSGNYEYEVKDDGTVEILKYNGSETNLVLPSVIASMQVTSIADHAFAQNTVIETVTIPENIQSIDRSAFSDCTALKTVNFNAIDCDGAVLAVFDGCSNLSTINIGSKVTKIGSHLFQGTTIESITIPASVKEIQDRAFKDSSLKSITIPENIQTIGYSAFSDCTALKTVNFNAIDCDGAVLPVFDGCSNLSTINIGSKVTKIGSHLFQETMIESITIPASVKEIQDRAFKGSTIKKITLPEGLLDISFDAFADCTKLTDVYYGGSMQSWAKIKIDFGNGSLTKANIHYAKVETTQKPTTAITVKSTKVKVANKKKKSNKIKISLKKIRGVNGYKIQVSTTKKFKKILVKRTIKKPSYVLISKKFKNKKRLYIRAKVFRKYNGKTYESKWSKPKKVKIKKK